MVIDILKEQWFQIPLTTPDLIGFVVLIHCPIAHMPESPTYHWHLVCEELNSSIVIIL